MTIINIPLSRYIRRKIKKLWNLPSLAKKLNLTVAKLESLRNQLIGLDSVRRKLLLIRKEKDKLDCCVVDLKDVQHCAIKKVYGSIPAGDLQTKGLNYYLQSVSLQLGLKSSAKAVSVRFYDSRYNTRRQQSFSEAAARKWERLVSDLLPKPSIVAQA
jgi:hypothetical protein